MSRSAFVAAFVVLFAGSSRSVSALVGMTILPVALWETRPQT